MQTPTGSYHERLMTFLHSALFLLFFLFAVLFLIGGCIIVTPENRAPATIPLLEKWNADYPVSRLDRLPAEQQDMPAGYIGDAETFIPVWRAFMPKEILPAIDFTRNIVVFTRNVEFYNRKFILKVALHDGIAEIISTETMSTMPVEEKVSMAMAVIPRDGVMAIRAGTEKIQVLPYL